MLALLTSPARPTHPPPAPPPSQVKTEGGTIIRVEAHPIPEHPRPKRVQGRVTLVGDAAGYVTKCSGEGIYFAAKSGRMAAEAVVEGSQNGTRMIGGCGGGWGGWWGQGLGGGGDVVGSEAEKGMVGEGKSSLSLLSLEFCLVRFGTARGPLPHGRHGEAARAAG